MSIGREERSCRSKRSRRACAWSYRRSTRGSRESDRTACTSCPTRRGRASERRGSTSSRSRERSRSCPCRSNRNKAGRGELHVRHGERRRKRRSKGSGKTICGRHCSHDLNTNGGCSGVCVCANQGSGGGPTVVEVVKIAEGEVRNVKHRPGSE